MTEIFFYNECTGRSGTERYLFNLIQGLDRSRFSPHILIPALRPCEHPAFRKRFDTLGVPITVFDYPSTTNFIINVLWFSRYFSKISRDFKKNCIFHFNQYNPGANMIEIIAARWAGVPALIATNHLATLGYTGLDFFAKLIASLSYKCLDAIIVESENNKKIAIKFRQGDPRKIHIINYGLNISFFRDNPNHVKGDYAAWEPVIGTIGRLEEQKGHQYLIEAISILKRDYPKVRLLIAGTGSLLNQLQGLIKSYNLENNAQLMGHCEDISKFLSDIDIFVLSSIYEGLPFSILEAMAVRKPVVATDVDGVRDVVINQETGLLVKPRNPQALVEAIRYLLNTPQACINMADAGYNKVSESYSLQQMVSKTQDLYEVLLKKCVQ